MIELIEEFNKTAEVFTFPAKRNKKPPPQEFEVFVIYWTDDLERVDDEQNRNWRAVAARSTEQLAQQFILEQPTQYGIRYGYERFPFK